MEFKFKAKKNINEIVEGVIQADSLEHAVEKVEQQGMVAVSIEPKSSKVDLNEKHTGQKLSKWGSKQLTLFTQKLYNLVKSRVELLSALKLLEEASKDPVEKAILQNIIKNVKDGRSFSECIGLYPKYFPQLYINIIRTGESTGQLRESLAQLLTQLERMEQLRSKVRQALAYPIFMIVVGAATVFIMLTFVMPRIASMFTDFQSTLPLPTLILLNISGFLRKFWLMILGVLALFFVVLQRSQGGSNNLFSSLKYRIPFIRNLAYKQGIANFSTSTSLLLKSGVTLLSAIGLTAPIIGDPKYVKQLYQVCQDIRDGSTFSQSLSKVKIFPDFFMQMIKVGEEGGRLDSVLEDLAATYEEEIEADLKIISSLIEPAIILVLGLVIGGIVIAALLPIFNITALVGS